MTPRVLFVDHSAVMGGAEHSLFDLVRTYEGPCRAVLFEDGPFREKLDDAGVEVHVLRAGRRLARITRDGGVLGDLPAVPALLRTVGALVGLARDADVLYANSQKSMIASALAGVLARKPVIWHLRDLLTEAHFSRAHRTSSTTVARGLVRRIIANSEATRRACIRSGCRASQVVTVHNGIDPGLFETTSPVTVDTLRHHLGLNGEPVVGLFGRLAEWKGQHVLLAALAQVRDAHALIVGDALFQVDRAYARDLRTLARELGIEHRVHFLGYRDDVPSLLQMVDVVAHTSTAPEPFGRVVVEAMMAGKPVIASDAGGVREIVEDGVTGTLVPPEQPAALAQAIESILRDPDASARRAARGAAEAREKFSLDRMRVNITAHIHDVAARGR